MDPSPHKATSKEVKMGNDSIPAISLNDSPPCRNSTYVLVFSSDTTSTEMTVHRMVFDELSSNEFFFFWGGGTIPSNWLG